MGYFQQLSEKYKPSSLWAYYSMLKGTMKETFNIDIGRYHQLSGFLKQKAKGYKPVQSKTFSEAESARFFNEAPDSDWLDVKVSFLTTEKYIQLFKLGFPFRFSTLCVHSVFSELCDATNS